mmetsp:Transcript_24382/g.96071  ORF Transcript_24382/g.96071 Transcript_24382/m.96071 type:complete len:123 (+) Transcript_24382:538-906(+)
MTEKRRRKDEVRAEKDVKRVKSMVSSSKKAMDNCRLCLRDKATGWHRVFSVAPESYLVVPRNPLAHGHCMIIPFDHEVGPGGRDVVLRSQLREISLAAEAQPRLVYIRDRVQSSQRRSSMSF